MSKYYHLKVKEVIKETDDSVSIHFWHPWNEVIRYKPGQYLTVLWTTSEGVHLRRSYSLSSSPFTDVSPAVTVKRVAGGIVSNYLIADVAEGDTLEVMQPAGTFCLVPDAEAARTIFLLGTGSGITPLLSIAKSVLIVEPESEIVLLYGNRRQEDIIFHQSIDLLKQKYGERLHVVHSLTQPPEDWSGETGRLTENKLTELLSAHPDALHAETSRFYLCGQHEFMNGAKQALSNLGVSKELIFSESFVTTKELTEIEIPAHTADSVEKISKSKKITLQYEGEEHLLEVAPHQSVLEAALENDIDLPYSCQAGMCTACLGRVLKGKVELDEYDALTDAEIKEGFILTCVAHPQSDDVIIEVE